MRMVSFSIVVYLIFLLTNILLDVANVKLQKKIWE